MNQHSGPSGDESAAPLRGSNAAIAGDRFSLHKKAVAALERELSPNEEVQLVIKGSEKQAIIATDHRLFVFKPGFMAGAAFGAEVTSIDYRQITGIQVHTGMMSGAVVVQAPGFDIGVSTNVWKNTDTSPYKAPNVIPINRPWAPIEEEAAKLRQLIAQAHSEDATPSEPGPASSTPSTADELHKLAELRDAGVISAGEFDQLKAKLLAG